MCPLETMNVNKMCPFTYDEINLPCYSSSMLLKHTKIWLDLRTFVAKSGLSRLRAFWGALLAKIWWMGAQKHFSGQRDSGLIKNHSKDLYIFIYLNSEDQWKIATIIFFYNTTSWYRFNLKLIHGWKSQIPNYAKKTCWQNLSSTSDRLSES